MLSAIFTSKLRLGLLFLIYNTALLGNNQPDADTEKNEFTPEKNVVFPISLER